MTTNLRPGVYSSYDITSFYTANPGAKHAGVVAKGDGGEPDKLYTFNSYAEVCEIFSAGSSPMRGISKILFESGVPRVYAVKTDGDYKNALELLEETDNIGAVVCDAVSPSDLEELRRSVERSSAIRRERVAFAGANTVQEAITAANGVNSERVVICGTAVSPRGLTASGAVYCAAAVAGFVLATADAAHNFSGEILRTVEKPERAAESEIQRLLANGVTAVESSGGAVRIIRALTTRTMSGDVGDRAMSGLNTILIIDSVISGIRTALETRLRGGRISGGNSFESIASQVMVELAGLRDNGMIETFAPPRVSRHPADPATCVVELSFHVAHVLNQIHIMAHVQV